jgi:hypothetical protein
MRESVGIIALFEHMDSWEGLSLLVTCSNTDHFPTGHMSNTRDQESHFTEFVAQVAAGWRSFRTKPMRASHARARRAIASGIKSRGLSRIQVAVLTGLSPSGFDKARREGRYPRPTLPGGRYDRTLVEMAMDRLSEIDDKGLPTTALDKWRKRGSRAP